MLLCYVGNQAATMNLSQQPIYGTTQMSSKKIFTATIQKDYPDIVCNIDKLQKSLAYTWNNRNLLLEALTHSSYAGEVNRSYKPEDAIPCNERLEFLGDSVLSLVISEELVANENKFAEGELSRIRASLVNEKTLASISQEFELGSFIFMSSGETRAGGSSKPSLLADALEALIGAIFIDAGFEAAQKVILSIFRSRLDKPLYQRISEDYKTQLQELTQKKLRKRPDYLVTDIHGPDHAPCFEVSIDLANHFLGKGQGRSKKEASQKAAKEALGWLRTDAGKAFQNRKYTEQNNQEVTI